MWKSPSLGKLMFTLKVFQYSLETVMEDALLFISRYPRFLHKFCLKILNRELQEKYLDPDQDKMNADS